MVSRPATGEARRWQIGASVASSHLLRFRSWRFHHGYSLELSQAAGMPPASQERRQAKCVNGEPPFVDNRSDLPSVSQSRLLLRRTALPDMDCDARARQVLRWLKNAEFRWKQRNESTVTGQARFPTSAA